MSLDIPSIKIVMLGESGVGKTSIISKYITNTFLEKEQSTLGASFLSKIMTYDQINQTLRFEIWDTAGQERFRSITRIFYKDATAAILVYDITRKNSFTELKDYWYNQLVEAASNKIIIAIVGNKADLIAQEEVDEFQARMFAQKIGAIYRQTSVRTAAGIEDLFKAVAIKFFDPTYKEDLSIGLRKTTIVLTKNQGESFFSKSYNQEKAKCCK